MADSEAESGDHPAAEAEGLDAPADGGLGKGPTRPSDRLMLKIDPWHDIELNPSQKLKLIQSDLGPGDYYTPEERQRFFGPESGGQKSPLLLPPQ
jgi:hypothetical protein